MSAVRACAASFRRSSASTAAPANHVCAAATPLCSCGSPDAPRTFAPNARRADMSYRAFKHLIGETSLERKCRFLFGGGILLLITASFWLYAYQTEHLAYDQTTTTCRVLINQIFDKHHTP